MREIGGYFELELNRDKHFHNKALKLNTGRNCLEYILLAANYNKLYLPYYVCDVLLEPLHKLKIDYEFYHIDKNLDPLFSKRMTKREVLLYVNYFGIKDQTVKQLAHHYKNLIVDNTQAFYSKPHPALYTFYSARKFFGVADGSYLYTKKIIKNELAIDTSYDRMQHLLKRIDLNAKEGYEDFKANDAYLTNQPIKQMSRVTDALLCNINYKRAKAIREENFSFIHSCFKNKNEIKVNKKDLNGPMIYPLLISGNNLRDKLIEQNIYVASYWNEVTGRVQSDSYEMNLSNSLLPIPIDQRYSLVDMKSISKTLSTLML